MYDEKINILNPLVSEEKTAALARCLAEGKMSHLNLLDISTSLLLVDLFYRQVDQELKLDTETYDNCLALANKASKFLFQQCVDDNQRLLVLAFLIKAMVSSLSKDV